MKRALTIITLSTCLLTFGCSTKQPVVQTEVVYQTIPEHLLEGCRMTTIVIDSESTSSYEGAFYAIADAYVSTAENMAHCNNKLETARQYNNRYKEK